MNRKSNIDQQYPLIAPCKKLVINAPITWLKLGFKDVARAPASSLSFGFVMSSMLMAVSFMVWQKGGAWLMMSLLLGFVFFAPIACVGLYAISAQLERNEPVSLLRALRACFKRYIGTELVFILILLVVFLVWARAGSMVSIFLPSSPEASLSSMTNYFLFISIVSLLFLSITFAISVFSLPMIMHRDVDAVTALVTSIHAVLRNKLVMIFWGALIAILILLGILSAGLLLVIILPAIGHAVWYGYQETIDATDFPRHRVGITSKPIKKNSKV